MFIHRTLKAFFVLLLVVVLAAATYALAATNTVNPSNAGEGAAAISGYTVSAIHYVLNAGNASIIDSVTFTVNVAPPAGSTMRIQLDTPGGTWYSCTNAGTAVTCNTTDSPTVTNADQLTIIIAQ